MSTSGLARANKAEYSLSRGPSKFRDKAVDVEVSHPLMASPNEWRLSNAGHRDHLEQGATQHLGFLKTVLCVQFPINDQSYEQH